MSGKFKRMEFVKELQLRPRIKLELESGEIFSVDYLPHDVADELVKRWNAYEDRASAIPPREPTEDQRDAARYRWLRENPTYMGWEHEFAPEWIDRLVDEEMAEKEGR